MFRSRNRGVAWEPAEHRGADVSKASDTDAGLTAGAEIVPGKVGDAINITSTKSYVDLGNRVHPLLDGHPSVTVSAWIKPNALPADKLATIFGSRVTGGAAGIDLLLNGSNVQMGGRSIGSDTYQARTFPLGDAGNWHHLTAVWDFAGDDMRLFVDGQPQEGHGAVSFGSNTYEVGDPGQRDRIGVSPSGDLPFDGAIDEVRIFDVAADQAMARSLAGLDGAPALAGLWVNGRAVAGLNPSVHHYDVVVPRGQVALIVGHASPGARVQQPFCISWLSDRESKPLTFTARRGKLTQTYTMTVRRASGDTSLAGVETADGAARSFGIGTTSYHVPVVEQPGKALDLTLDRVTALRTWDGATAEGVSQADPDDRRPVAVVRVVAENGATATHKVLFDVRRVLVSATAAPRSGDAPLPVTLAAVPTKWAVGAVTYDWDFGDGSRGTGAQARHTYQRVGQFNATVTVRDSTGATDSVTVPVPVRVRDADRLVGSWKFDGSAPGLIVDDSPYANNGTVTGADRVPGCDGTGTALRLNGTGGAVLDDAIGTDLDGAPAITISAWVRPGAASAAGKIGNWVLGTRVSGGGAGAELYMLGGALRVGGRSQVTDPYVRSDYSFTPDGSWHHVTAVLDYANDDIRLFLDGVQQDATSHAGSFGSQAYTYVGASQPDSIGRSPDGAYRFTGDLDDVQLRGRALSAEEVVAGARRQSLTPGPAGHP